MSLSTLLAVGASALIAASSAKAMSPPVVYYFTEDGCFVLNGIGWIADPQLTVSALKFTADQTSAQDKSNKLAGFVYNPVPAEECEEFKAMHKTLQDALTCGMDSMDFDLTHTDRKYVPGEFNYK